MRLDKFLSNNKLGTRTEVKKALKKGICTVNGEIIKKPEHHIDENDEIVYMGQKITNMSGQNIYIMLNKPKGVVSATKDNYDQTVIDLLGEDATSDLFPVGRLDKDTTGLLIITNDGIFAHNTLSPKKHVEKKYYVELDGEINQDMVDEFKRGVVLKEYEICKPAKLEILEGNKCYLTITEGKFHQIKRMFIKVGLEVLELERVSFGDMVLDNELEYGEFRYLTDEEIESVNK